MLTYVVLRQGGKPMSNHIYSPRKQGFLDKLERSKLTKERMSNVDKLIKEQYVHLPTKKKEPTMSIGDEAMSQLRNLATEIEIDLAHTVGGFNSTYRSNGSCDEVDQMVAMEEVDDQVNAPSHYMLWPDTEVVDLIRKVLTEDELRGWYKGNSLKYRLRLGAKDIVERDLGKAEKFEQWLGDLY